MRAVVGNLARAIKIQGSQGDFGCRIIIFGSAILKGVEIINCGHDDYAGLSFLSSSRVMSYVVGCTLHDSSGPLMSAVRTNDLLIESNIFYNGVRTLVTLLDGINNRFQNNALITVRLRSIEGGLNWAALGSFLS
jgi:hypothetical protein